MTQPGWAGRLLAPILKQNGGQQQQPQPYGAVNIIGASVAANTATGDLDVTIPTGVGAIPNSVLGLRSLVATASRQFQNVDFYSTPGDGGGGQFNWNSTDTRADDGGTILAVTGVAMGRWNRTGVSSSLSVAWYGGLPNALFFNASNGKWYQNVGLTVEATDDSAKFLRTIAAAQANGAGSVYIPPGNWYLKSAPAGTHGEYFVIPSNMTVRGDGDVSAIWIGPGINTVGQGGWATVFGRNPFNPGSAVNNVQFLRFSVHCNGQHNQWPSANFGGPLPAYTNIAVSVPFGNNITVDHVNVFDHVGPFQILVGLYGNPQSCTNYAITGCTLNHGADDPNVGDISWISCSGTNGLVTGNRIDYAGSSSSAAWGSQGGAPACAIEVHGFNTVVAHNTINGTASAINSAADSYDGGSIDINHNVITNATAGLSLNAINGHAMRGFKYNDNIVRLRATGNPSAPENGLAFSSFSTLSVPIGLGIFDFECKNNVLIGAPVPTANCIGMLMQQHQTGGNSVTLAAWVATTAYSPFHLPNCIVPTVLNGFYYVVTAAGTSGSVEPTWPTTPGQTVTKDGVTYMCVAATVSATIATGGGYTISGNKVRGFRNYGMIVTVPDGAGANNLCQGVHFYGNELCDVGPTGIAVGGSASDTGADFVDLQIVSNSIIDDRGGSATLVNPITIAAFTDSTSIWHDNRANGYSGSAIVNITDARALNYWPSETFRQLTSSVPNVGASLFAGLLLVNPIAASSGTPSQYAPAWYQQGSYWNGSAPKNSEGVCQLIPAAHPSLAFQMRLDGAGSYITGLQVTVNDSAHSSLSFGATNVTMDLSGGSGRAFVVNVDAAGDIAFQTSGTTHFDISAAHGANFTCSETTSAPSAGGASALPATPAKYETVYFNGVARQIAVY